MEKKNKTYTHLAVTDRNGKEYLCPDEPPETDEQADIDFNVCFEKDVPGRYAAQIKVRES